MARRYVPKTYNNRRMLRIITGGIITLALSFAILFLILYFVLQRYVVDGQLLIPLLMDETPQPVIMQTEAPARTEKPMVIDEPTLPPLDDIQHTGDDQTDDPGVSAEYSIAQVQAALQEQFMANAFGERNPQVVSVEKVNRDRDFISIEGAGPDASPVDLTSSARYKVEYRFEQPIDEYNIWEETYPDPESRPFRRDGNYTIMTDYFYFNDVNGEPKLAFIKD